MARASVAFDYRQVAGELYVDKVLTDVMREAPEHQRFLSGLVKLGTKVGRRSASAASSRAASTSRRTGSCPSRTSRATTPSPRASPSASTLERLHRGARGRAARTSSPSASLREAFVSMQHLQLRHHANRLRNGRPVDNVIETWTLRPLTRASLQEALREVVSAQKRFKPVGGRRER